MRLRLVLFLVGCLAILFGVNMLPAVAWGLFYGEYAAVASLLWSMGITIGLGIAAVFAFRRYRTTAGPREGFAVAALGWIVLAAFGALPFFIGGYIPHYIDCYFETMSGLTTTGASILTSEGGALSTDIEALPRCLLFWRSYTHWIGGDGHHRAGPGAAAAAGCWGDADLPRGGARPHRRQTRPPCASNNQAPVGDLRPS